MHGSQKGDVYSFAIVLQEIITRSGPFETVKVVGGDGKFSVVSLDPQFIIHQLKLNSATPYRPKVDPNECSAELTELLTSCWEENPANRPSFQAIKSTISKIAKYVFSSLVKVIFTLHKLTNELFFKLLEILLAAAETAFWKTYFSVWSSTQMILKYSLIRKRRHSLRRRRSVKICCMNFYQGTVFLKQNLSF